jgi:hypothetical protein
MNNRHGCSHSCDQKCVLRNEDTTSLRKRYKYVMSAMNMEQAMIDPFECTLTPAGFKTAHSRHKLTMKRFRTKVHLSIPTKHRPRHPVLGAGCHSQITKLVRPCHIRQRAHTGANHMSATFDIIASGTRTGARSRRPHTAGPAPAPSAQHCGPGQRCRCAARTRP